MPEASLFYGGRMTLEMNQLGQPNAGAHDLEAKLVRLAEFGKAPTPGQVKREEIKARFLAALKQHGTLSAACQVAGTARATIYRWRDEDPVFAAQVHQWMHVDMEAELVESLFRIATSTDPKMANAAVRAGEVLLKADRPEKYGDRLQIEQQVTVNVAVQTVDAFMQRQRAAMQQLERSVSPVIEADFRVESEREP